MRKLIRYFLLASAVIIGYIAPTTAQTPQGFNYQAVLRDTEGKPISEQNVGIKASLQNQDGSVVYYSETHSVTTTTEGLISLTIGEGTVNSGEFPQIPWEEGGIQMKIEVDMGEGYNTLGINNLQAVPYALYAHSSAGSTITGSGEAGRLAIWNSGNTLISSANLSFENYLVITSSVNNIEDPIFVVKNKDGLIVFAVYENGVRVYVDENDTKGSKGGFAIGGLSPSKELSPEYFRVTPDSVRVYIDTTSIEGKGSKGGFAIGGLSPSKGISEEYFRVTRDSSRIYVNTEDSKGGSKGGFAVGGLSPSKQDQSSFMFLTPENYFIGHDAGSNTTTGLYNIFIGFESGFSNTEGYENSFIGHESGWSNTLGYSNVFLGNGTGRANTEGMYNVFVGNYAGSENTIGYSNVMIGDAAGESNTIGSSNVFIGDWSGSKNTEGEGNIFIGDASGWSNLTGAYNIFMGPTSGYLNTTGEGNVFLGDESGYSNNGNWNVYLGNSSGFSNQTGNENVFIGIDAGYGSINGNENVYIGPAAGYENTEGNNNIFIGSYAGYSETGSSRLYIENSDTDSTDALIFGNFDTDILQVNYSLGVGRYPSENELEVEGEASKSVAGNWLANADKRTKTDIQDIENAFETLLKLRPVKFKYSDLWKKKHPSIKDIYYYNFIAQDFQQVFPESVKGSGEFLEGSRDETLQLDTYNAHIISIKAVQELILENRKQQEEIETLKAELEAIKALLTK